MRMPSPGSKSTLETRLQPCCGPPPAGLSASSEASPRRAARDRRRSHRAGGAAVPPASRPTPAARIPKEAPTRRSGPPPPRKPPPAGGPPGTPDTPGGAGELRWKAGRAPRSRLDAVVDLQRSDAVPERDRLHQLRHLADVAEIVERPEAQDLGELNLPRDVMDSPSLPIGRPDPLEPGERSLPRLSKILERSLAVVVRVGAGAIAGSP